MEMFDWTTLLNPEIMSKGPALGMEMINNPKAVAEFMATKGVTPDYLLQLNKQLEASNATNNVWAPQLVEAGKNIEAARHIEAGGPSLGPQMSRSLDKPAVDINLFDPSPTPTGPTYSPPIPGSVAQPAGGLDLSSTNKGAKSDPLLDTLRGIKAPTAPTPYIPKVGTPPPPTPRGVPNEMQMLRLLAMLRGTQTKPQMLGGAIR